MQSYLEITVLTHEFSAMQSDVGSLKVTGWFLIFSSGLVIGEGQAQFLKGAPYFGLHGLSTIGVEWQYLSSTYRGPWVSCENHFRNLQWWPSRPATVVCISEQFNNATLYWLTRFPVSFPLVYHFCFPGTALNKQSWLMNLFLKLLMGEFLLRQSVLNIFFCRITSIRRMTNTLCGPTIIHAVNMVFEKGHVMWDP